MNLGEASSLAGDLFSLINQRLMPHLVAAESALDVARRSRAEEYKRKAIEALAKVRESVLKTDDMRWTPSQVELAGRFGIYDFMSGPGLHRINDIEERARNQLDSAYSELVELRKKVENTSKAVAAVKEGLTPLVRDGDSARSNLLTLFLGARNVGTGEDLKKTAADWGLIMGDLARAVGADPEKVRVVGGVRGSFGIEWAVPPDQLAMMGDIVRLALEVKLAWLLLRKEQAYLEPSTLIGDVEKERARKHVNEKKTPSERQIDQIIDAFAAKVRDKPEELARTRLAIRKTVEYVVEGTLVDPKLPGPEARQALGALQHKVAVEGQRLDAIAGAVATAPRLSDDNQGRPSKVSDE